MFRYDTRINTANGTCNESCRSKIVEKKLDNGVTALFIKALCSDKAENSAIDSDKGVEINVYFNDKIKGYMADYRYSEFWCRPYFSNDFSNMPDETQALVVELENGEFCVVVPVVNETYKCVLKGKENNAFTARIFSWYENLYRCDGLAFVYAIAKRPGDAMEKCVKSALELLNNGVRHRSQRNYPTIFDYLGWCSWDSMQIRVNEQGLLDKCEEFKEKNIPVKYAIIDDMWAEIRDFYDEEYSSFTEMISVMYDSSLYSFEADPKRFPNGLKNCISKVNDYGIKVGMWHPTTGYWKGFDEKGEAYKILKDYLIKAKNGYIVPDWNENNAYMYYNTIHEFFRKCGAEFIKVDNQSMTRRYYKNSAPVGVVSRAFHNGMEASAGANFNSCMINCMGMGSEDIWNRKVSPISRCSNDFKPEDSGWFANHVLQCAYNSMFQGELYWCDWDMWWTDDGQAKKNSLMRAISGGPIYVSDKIGRSNADILKPLTLDNGKVLRCDKPCTPTYDCVTVDPTNSGYALKLQNTVGDYGVMAVININQGNNEVKSKISGKYIDGFSADEYAVYEHFSRELTILKGHEEFEITLSDTDDYRLYIFAPIKNGFAAIGRIDKFISPKTIDYTFDKKVVLTEKGPYAYVLNGKLYFDDNSLG